MRRSRPDDAAPSYRRQLALKLGLARLAGGFERWWPALMPALALLTSFLLISLLGLWALLPGWLHGALLALFGVGLIASLWHARRAFRVPDRADGLRRLEQQSGLNHRPLGGLEDDLATHSDDPAARALWRRHQSRLAEQIKRLRVGVPDPGMAKRDPRAWRVLAALVLIVAVIYAGASGPTRLALALQPGFQDVDTRTPTAVQLWFTPPSYTGEPIQSLTVDLAAEEPSRISVPLDTLVLSQLHHPRRAGEGHSLSLDGSAASFAATGPDSFEAEMGLSHGGPLRLTDEGGAVVAEVEVSVRPDLAPDVAFTEPPSASQRRALKLSFAARDDYGVTALNLLLAQVGTGLAPEEIELRQPSGQQTDLEGFTYVDLTAHPLAGLPVILRLQAYDGREQMGLSEPVTVTLPERVFTDPLAQMVIAERRTLAGDHSRRKRTAARLNGLSEHPLTLEAGPFVAMVLRSSGVRLFLGDPAPTRAINEVVDTLWELALYLEDGGMALAEDQMRRLQEQLREAMENGASDEELQRLMAELQEAMNAYLQEMMRQMAEQGMQPNPEAFQQMPNQQQEGQIVTQDDLNRMMQQMQELMQQGAMEQAMQMLSQLQQMLENLQPMQQAQGPQQEMMQDLQNMIQEQQNLLDQSYRMDQENQSGQPQSGEGDMQPMDQRAQQSGEQQEQLRRQLGELMRQLGEQGMDIPRSLGEAEMQMRGAEQALGEGQPGEAIDPQASALDQLRQGGRAMMEQMQQQAGQTPGQPGMGQQPGGQPFGQTPGLAERDPLGRSPFNEGGVDRFGVEVPDEADMGRARQILEELYRRSGQRLRPEQEQRYIERLLERF